MSRFNLSTALAPLAPLVFIGLTFCQADESDVLEALTDATEHAVYYELSFDDTDVDSAGADFIVTTNLGYRVSLREGQLNTQSAQLVPCKTTRRWFAPRSAFAGHSEGDGDPSAVDTSLTESLTIAATSELGAALSDRIYCAIAIEVGPTGAMDGLTMSLELAVEDSDGWAERSIALTGTYSRQAELSETINIGEYSAKLIFERKLSSMFDNIEFDEATDTEIADRTITNLLANAEILIYTDN